MLAYRAVAPLTPRNASMLANFSVRAIWSGAIFHQRLVALVAAAIMVTAFSVLPADARTKKKSQYRVDAPSLEGRTTGRPRVDAPSLDGRITGRPRTCGYTEMGSRMAPTATKPSCLISCSHASLVGGCGALVGRHGGRNRAHAPAPDGKAVRRYRGLLLEAWSRPAVAPVHEPPATSPAPRRYALIKIKVPRAD